MYVPIIILAAGASSRMGARDKLMERVDGQPLIARQAAMALAVTAAPVIVALPPAPHPRYDALKGLPVQICEVADASDGMSNSMRRAAAALPDKARGFMLLLGDLPDLTEEDLRMVLQASDFSTKNLVWRGVTQDGKPGHPIVFSAELLPYFAELSGDNGGRDILHHAEGRIVLIPLPGKRARADLDTPKDWAAWRAANPSR